MSELPIYNDAGWVIGWLVGNVVFARSGVAAGFVEDGTVFSYLAQHLGEFYDGFFRDRAGDAVAFIEGADGGPLLPITQAPPVTPILQTPLIQPITPIPPLAPLGTLSWSGLTWDDFLGAVRW